MKLAFCELWNKYQWLVYLVSIAFTAGTAYAALTGVVERVTKLETAYETVPPTLSRIEQKVDDLKDYFRRH